MIHRTNLNWRRSVKARLSCVAMAFVCISVSHQPTPAQPANAPRYVGAGACSAAACHNSHIPQATTGSEYSTWITRDPHARAYEILFNKRSQAMQTKLRRNVAAYEDGRCLRCHVAPNYDVAKPPTSYFKTDGVSCESCHGPASAWINRHHLDAWQQTTAFEKLRLGMHDTSSLVGRAQVCAKCHVGAAGMEVDHELIAAGHPRLNFEFSAFHAHLPRHWSDAKDRAGKADFDAEAWVAGQLATAHAALDLLAARAGDAKAWPEFAEFDCAACHHRLQDPSPRQKLGVRKPGSWPWGTHVALLPIAVANEKDADKLRERVLSLQKIMNASQANRTAIATAARAAELDLRALLPRADVGAAPNRKQFELALFARRNGASVDELTQIHLALAALRPNSKRTAHVQSFDPEAIRVRLTPLKEISKDR
jgi:cytochrome c554/c'-like protein